MRLIPGYPGISQPEDRKDVLGYPITRFLEWDIPGYPFVVYPGITRYKSG